MRIDGFGHNLLDVLLVPGFPIGLIGLVALPWTAPRSGRSGRSLLVSLLTFLDHDPGLPGGDHLGHLPPRGRAGPRPADRRLPARARRLIVRVGALARLDQAGGLARRRP